MMTGSASIQLLESNTEPTNRTPEIRTPPAACVLAFLRTHGLLFPVLALAGYLRLRQISTMGVSFDESFTQRMVEFPWGEMLARIGEETQPPLFYAVLKLWSELFGGSVVAGRTLTIFLGVAAVAGIYAFVRTAYWRRDQPPRENFRGAQLPALVSAMLLAIAPLAIHWDQQIRMYSLPIALSLWSGALLLRALDAPVPRLGHWVSYTLAAILLAYSHYFGLFVLLAQFAYGLISSLFVKTGHWFDRVSPLLLSGCVLSLAWQPWLLVFLGQRSGVSQSFYLPDPSWELLGVTTHELWVGVGKPLSSEFGLLIAELTFLILAALLAGRRKADWLLAALAVIPVALAFIISAISHPIITARYFLFSHVFVLAAIAVVICRLPGMFKYVAIALTIGVLSKPCWDYARWREAGAALPGMEGAMQAIEATRQDNPLVISNPMLFTSAVTYAQDRNQIFNFKPPGGFPMYQGTPVMRDRDYVDERWLRESDAAELWTIGASGYMGHVPVPPRWKLVREERYPEWFGELFVRLHDRDHQAADR